MTWLLHPGIGLARRERGQLQLGVDPPMAAVVADTPEVRLLLTELAHAAPLTSLDAETAPVLETLVAVGLVVEAETTVRCGRQRARTRVYVDAPAPLARELALRLGAAGLRVAHEAAAATVALVWGVGEPARSRVDGWMRAGTPHLVVRELPGGPVVGPYAVPGVTACLRCVDAGFDETEPQRALVVEQMAVAGPLRPHEPDAAARELAAAWTVHDLVTTADGGQPASWSATVTLGSLPPVVTSHRRHVHCGCGWGELDRPVAG